MNGISFKTYSDFEKKWKLVTVRYREDSGEMRWVYANPPAWKALKEGNIDYPDGSVFAKVGIKTEVDQDFPSSRVPSGARRTQYMVRDKKGYAETGGWGYALFNQAEVTYNEDPKATAVSCHACHQIVPQRGFVFSQFPTLGSSAIPAASMQIKSAPVGVSGIKFDSKPWTTLPAVVRQMMPTVKKQIRLYQTTLIDHAFDGTVDEVRPLLALEAVKSQLPSAFVSKDGSQFSVVYLIEDSTELSCQKDQRKLMSLSTLRLASDKIRKDDSGVEQVVRVARFCYSKN